MANSNTHAVIREFERIQMRQRSDGDRSARLESDYAAMHKVVDFFFEGVKDISSEERKEIEEKLFDKRTSHSKLGTILFLQKFADGRYPDWIEHAKKKFGIDY